MSNPWAIVGCISCDDYIAGISRTGTVQETIIAMCNEHNAHEVPVKASLIVYDDMPDHVHLVIELPETVRALMERTHSPSQDNAPVELLRSLLYSLRN